MLGAEAQGRGLTMEVQFWATTDVGRVRDHNEDNFLVDKRLNLFVVCDGMGGHSAGEVASAVAVRAIREVVANNREILERCKTDSNDLRLRQDLLKLLEYAVQEACTRIFDMAQSDPDRRGMGTTCSMLAVIGRRCFIAHVGDSRIYLHRKGQVHQLTEDHTLVNEMLRRGKVKDPKTVASKYKNAITRAVGVYESVEVDTLDFDTLPGDRFLLCSDGLSGYLDEEDEHVISDFVGPQMPGSVTTQDELKSITGSLIDYANRSGGKDNITAVVVALCEDTDDLETEEVRLTMETIRDVPLFHYLSYKELVRVVNVTRKRTCRQGEWLIEEGADGEELFLIMRGLFGVEKGGREIARLSQGGHFGEMALIDESPRSASVRCLSSGTLLTVSRKDFYDLLREDSALAVKLLWNFIQTLSERLRTIPVPPPSRGRRFEDAPTGNNYVPPLPSSEELGVSGMPTLDGSSLPELDADEDLLQELQTLEGITGEEITLPGLKVKSNHDEPIPRPQAPARRQTPRPSDSAPHPRARPPRHQTPVMTQEPIRRHRRHDIVRRSSSMSSISERDEPETVPLAEDRSTYGFSDDS